MKKNQLALTNTGITIILILAGILLYNILNGLTLIFPDLNQSSLLSKFSEIHFSSPGNNFGGGVFWLPVQSLSKPVTISVGGVTKTCQRQLRGIYYNSARGARLWPLDNETLGLLTGTGGQGYENLSLSGGLYTVCGSGSDLYSIYGYIEYDWQSTKSYLIAGTKLNYQNNAYIPQFSHNFEYFNNSTPLGYFWDSVGGIGFVGGILSGNENLLNYLNTTGSINSSFIIQNNTINTASGSWGINLSGGSQAQDTMRNILVQGNVILSKAIDIYERKALLGNLERKTILINSDINSATVINAAKKNAETLCRGKTYFTSESEAATLIEEIPDGQIICTKGVSIEINLANSDSYKDKTIIVKDGNIIISNTMNKESPSLDLFVDRGNLYINNTSEKTSFNQEGYPSSENKTNEGVLLKGSFILNGLLLGGTPETPSAISSKLHILGKLAFLNTPTAPSQGRVAQVQTLFSTKDFNDRINLENLFTWYCELNGTASDGTSCGAGNTSITVTPFVVLNAKYPSNILK